MKKGCYFFVFLLYIGCTNYGQLTVIADLPKSLKEVSGMQQATGADFLWMLNDSGNSAKLYQVSTQGKILKEVDVKAKNYDWEDLTSDDEGNLYIADIGNNENDRENLVILKIKHQNLSGKKKVSVQKIQFSYPEQQEFPAKKTQRVFDAESLFWFQGNVYVFTKSRLKNAHGKTSLYRIPATEGTYKATLISSFTTCNELECWSTSAAISSDGKKVALLNHKSVWLFTDFTGDDFFSGQATEFPFGHRSQKESVCFKDANTLYISDERRWGEGGKLYEFVLN